MNEFFPALVWQCIHVQVCTPKRHISEWWEFEQAPRISGFFEKKKPQQQPRQVYSYMQTLQKQVQSLFFSLITFKKNQSSSAVSRTSCKIVVARNKCFIIHHYIDDVITQFEKYMIPIWIVLSTHCRHYVLKNLFITYLHISIFWKISEYFMVVLAQDFYLSTY